MFQSHIYGNMGSMKTTVELEDALFKAARKRAVDESRPFRALLNDALRAYLGAAAAPEPRRRRRKTPTGPAAASTGETAAPEAEFWAVVNDRSRWDEMFGDRLQTIEDDIARATADWEKRRRA